MLDLYKQLRALQAEFGGRVTLGVNERFQSAELRWEGWAGGKKMRSTLCVAGFKLESGESDGDAFVASFAKGIREHLERP